MVMLNSVRNTAGSTVFCASRVMLAKNVREANRNKFPCGKHCGKLREGAGSKDFRHLLPALYTICVGLTACGKPNSAVGATGIPQEGNGLFSHSVFTVLA